MFIPYLRLVCLTFILSLFATATFAEIYKWVDENGQTHYSQQAPRDIQATVITSPPPPVVDSTAAQQEIDALIKQQTSDEQLSLEQQNQQQNDEEKKDNKDKNCKIAQQQLEEYQNNPGRRIMDADGNVTRLTEEERQQKIQESQENVTTYCQ
tara:strand:- start:1194 stop:1652 length:459 start_codon:yes stop_codon:yes gene_type:complete